MNLLRLQNEMTATARALSRQRVILEFEPMNKRGYCVTTKENIFLIGINPCVPLGTLYQTFLHETGHAYINGLGLKLPDKEAGAWEVATIWAIWIARRNPADEMELFAWLKKLRAYHEVNKNNYAFSGANRGRFLPMAAANRGFFGR